MVRAIANRPEIAAHITSLAYVVDVLYLERQTLDMFRTALRRDEHIDARMYALKPKLFDRPDPPATEVEIQETYAHYVRLHEEQDDILRNNRDFSL